eukprot:snap_masked-scaffold_7-processed-gene-17.8-mRNA-1 protein AED:1.00 eAED:1.00 QI:0/-1/0/0/-1/1/1/0/1171
MKRFLSDNQKNPSFQSIFEECLPKKGGDCCLPLENQTYEWNAGIHLETVLWKKSCAKSFLFKGSKNTRFSLAADSSIVVEGKVNNNLGTIRKTRKKLKKKKIFLDEATIHWIKFENIQFTSTEGITLYISKHSAVAFKNCGFEGVRINTEGLIRCNDCAFSVSTKYLIQGYSSVFFAGCTFEKSPLGVNFCPVKETNYLSVIRDCEFKNLKEAVLLKCKAKQICSINLTECGFDLCESAIRSISSTVSLNQLRISTCAGIGIELIDSVADLTGVKIVAATCGLEVSGDASETNLSQSLFRECNIGVNLVSLTLPTLIKASKQEINFSSSLVSCSFVKCQTGIRLENHTCQVLGCTFVLSELYSIQLFYPNFNSESLPKYEFSSYKAFPLRLSCNNHIETNVEAEFYNNEDLLWKLAPTNDKPFLVKSSFELDLYIENLAERLRAANFNTNYFSGTRDTALMQINSVRVLLLLNKQIETLLLKSKILRSDVKLTCFLATFPIPQNKNQPILSLEQLFELWSGFSYIQQYDEAIDLLSKLYRDPKKRSAQLLTLLKRMIDARIQKFISFRLSQKKLYLLNHLTEVSPLKTLVLLEVVREHKNYSVFSSENNYEYKKLEIDCLVKLATEQNDEENEDSINVKWIQITAAKVLLERSEEDLKTVLNFFDNSNDAASLLSNLIIELLLVLGQETRFKEFFLRYRDAGIKINDLNESIFEKIKGDILKTIQEGLEFCVPESVREEVGLGDPIPLLLSYVLSCSKGITVEELLQTISQHVPASVNKVDIVLGIAYELLCSNQPEIGAEITFNTGTCSQCGIFMQPEEHIFPCTTKEHIFCFVCLKENFTGKCPGGCSMYLRRSDMYRAGVSQSEISKIQGDFVSRALNTFIQSLEGKWHACSVDKCYGGSSIPFGKSLFCCCICDTISFISKDNSFLTGLQQFSEDRSLIIILFNLYQKAVQQSRFHEHFFPYSIGKQIFDPTKAGDKIRLKTLAQKFPKTETELESIEEPLVALLCEYVLFSNPTRIRRLSKEQFPDFLQVFLEVPLILKIGNVEVLQTQSNQEKELTFQRLKKRHGSYWAYHGSVIENWHSIIRTGLRVYSVSKYMTTGARLGRGIYHSESPRFAMKYSRNGMESKGALGVIEIVKNNIREYKSILVADNEDLVQLRYVIVFNYLR